MKKIIVTLMFFTALLPGSGVYANPVVEQLLEKYRQQGALSINPDQGKQLWYSESGDRSCTSCHGSSPAETGQHAKTGKLIKPMAASVNPERYRDGKKVEKWFLRNCKWTLGRECSVQEKADTLNWLNSF